MPRLLDLFSGGGGAGMGYRQAGFDVIGIDIDDHAASYAHVGEFHRMDWRAALDKYGGDVEVIHASPPCQDHSTTKVFGGDHGTGWMLAATLERLRAQPVPWVVENVKTASLAHQGDLFGAAGLRLCGCMFGELRGLLYEERVFQTSHGIPQPDHVRHVWPQTKMGRTPKPGECMQVTGHFIGVAEARLRMGLPWMTGAELAQAIPPAYTSYIGRYLREEERWSP